MAKFNVETTETSKGSFKVQPAPIAYSKKYGVGGTNPDQIGVASSKKGHTESK